MTDKDPALQAAWDILNRFPAHGKGYVVNGFASIIRRHFAEALEDGKRLDWLQTHGAQTWCNFTSPGDYSVQPALADFSFRETYRGDTLRAAIDSAMKADAARERDDKR